MSRRAGIRDASKATGLSEWELRQGAISGRYPHIRIGNSEHGRIIFDLDLLEQHIRDQMLQSLKTQEDVSVNMYGQLRQIKA